MKKGFLIFLMGIVSFLGINTVSADTYSTSLEIHNINFSVEENINFFIENKNIISKLYNDLYDEYIKEYSNLYPYYYISLTATGRCISLESCLSYTDSNLELIMYLYKDLPTINVNNNLYLSFSSELAIKNTYNFNNSYYVLPLEILSLDKNDVLGFPYYSQYFYSNFDLKLNFSDYSSLDLYLNNNSNYKLFLNNGDIFPTLHDYFKLNIISDPNSNNSTYVEIDLNQYSYVALSLKDYNNIPENNSSVYTNIWTKGQLCITPVYNYGMTERKDILTGTQVQRCSSYYNDFTSIRMYLLKTDVENHSIYYLKAYDTSKENIVKVDTSVFDITYITEDTKDNPYVSIGGKQYPTIAYDKLTDTATKSEDDDYNSGVSCPVGDLNCYNEYNSENIFDSVFDSPLKILKNIWSSITSVFDIITEFIMLLPEAMQSFLFLSFMIAIILGLIKIIL